MSSKTPNIFMFTLFLFGFSGINGTATDDHWHEKPAEKYSAKLNEQTLEDNDLNALREREAVDMAERLHMSGKDLFSVGNYKQAIWNFDESYKYQPLNPKNLESRAKCHLKMENYSFAFVDANEALNFDPDSKSARQTKVLAMIKLKRRSEAIIHEIEKINDPQLVEKYKDAVTQTDHRSNNKTFSTEEILEEAQSDFDEQDYQAALELYNKVLPHLPYASELYKNALKHRMKSLNHLKRTAETYADVTELLELAAADDKLEYHTMRAILLLDLDRVESIAEFEKVIELDHDKERAQKVKDIMAGAKMEMHQKRQLILDRAASGIPTSDNKIVELIIKQTEQPGNFITVMAANGKKYEVESFDSLMELLFSYHSRITRATFSGVSFNKEFIHMITSVDKVLWSGILRLDNCDFTQLSQKEILNLFRHTLKPESLYLILPNDGLTSDAINQAIKYRLLDCTLIIFGDDSEDMELDADELVDFLHRPTTQIIGMQRIITNPEFIDGGVNSFVDKIIKRFQSDTEPAPFLLQFTKITSLPFPSGTAILNSRTDELLVHETYDDPGYTVGEFVKQTALRRKPKNEKDD
ncbi:hypothetical protein Ddc_14116 [Ditylenchus destructor]|nr:hypothetical protein Ddc_14116 [Ditylenchus destructor]